MARVLVTGATGFVGGAVLAALRRAGHAPVAAIRRAGAPADAECRPVGEIGPDTDWRAALAGIDAVIHLAARVHLMRDHAADPDAAFRRVNTEGTRRLAEEAAAVGVGRLVFLSSVKAAAEGSARPLSERDPPAPRDAYGRSKLAAEAALSGVAAAGRLDVVTLRPPLVYGPGAQGNFRALVGLCRRGVPLPLGAVDNRRSLVALGNLADAAVCAATAPPAGPGHRLYYVRDGEDLSTAELVRRLRRALGRPPRLLAAPPGLLRGLARLAGRGAAADRLLGSLQVDDTAFRRDFGWTPPLTVDAALAEVAEDGR